MPGSLVVFDLDGTLIDSRRDLADAANALIVERGGSSLPVDAIAAMVGDGAAVLVRRALSAAGLRADDARALPRFLDLYDERLLAHTRLYDGIIEVLDELSATARLAILTNKPQPATGQILEGLNIARYFQWVIGGNSIHGRKPGPAGLLHLISLAGVTAGDTIMIGDSPIDLLTARGADTRICLARYGFGFDMTMPHLRGDEMIAASPSDIPRLLQPAG